MSHITVDDDGRPTVYSGRDATNLFRAKVLKGSIELYAKTGIIPTRGVTIKSMLALATHYTGKAYKHTGKNREAEYARAAEDLRVWIATMTTALPIVNEKGEQR